MHGTRTVLWVLIAASPSTSFARRRAPLRERREFGHPARKSNPGSPPAQHMGAASTGARSAAHSDDARRSKRTVSRACTPAASGPFAKQSRGWCMSTARRSARLAARLLLLSCACHRRLCLVLHPFPSFLFSILQNPSSLESHFRAQLRQPSLPVYCLLPLSLWAAVNQVKRKYAVSYSEPTRSLRLRHLQTFDVDGGFGLSKGGKEPLNDEHTVVRTCGISQD